MRLFAVLLSLVTTTVFSQSQQDFTADLVEGRTVLLTLGDDLQDGFLHSSADSIQFNNDGTGDFYSSKHLEYDAVSISPVTWSVEQGHLNVLHKQTSNYIILDLDNYYHNQNFILKWGKPVLDELKRARDQGLYIDSRQLEVTEVLEEEYQIVEWGDTDLLVDIKQTSTEQLVIPEDILSNIDDGWQAAQPEHVSQTLLERRGLKLSYEVLSLSPEDFNNRTWAIPLVFPLDFEIKETFKPLFYDKVTFGTDGNAFAMISEKTFGWEIDQNTLVLNDGNESYRISLLSLIDETVFASVEYSNDNHRAFFIGKKLARFNQSKSQLIDNLVTDLPEFYMSYSGHHLKSGWENGIPKCSTSVFGYQFMAGGKLKRGIQCLYEDKENQEDPYFSLGDGNKWTWESDENKVYLSIVPTAFWLERKRTWEVATVDENGYATVLEYSHAKMDVDFDGIADEWATGEYHIYPRLNIIKMTSMTDWPEALANTDISSGVDQDKDSITDDLDNCPAVANANQEDLDGEGVGDACDQDIDGDGLPNSWEEQYGLDPYDAIDAELDNDSDGLTNLQEFEVGTDPTNMDSDDDGISDGDEVQKGLDPLTPQCPGYLCGSTYRGWRLGTLTDN